MHALAGRDGAPRAAVCVLATLPGGHAYVPLPPAPGVPFAAHPVRGGLMVDAMRGDDRLPAPVPGMQHGP